MALKSATTTLATIQMRHGREEDFDSDQMTEGEWAVSTNKKYVRMCFMPGLCLRMATYEAFEKDMEEIRAILVEAKDIQLAIETWYKLSESYAHGGTGTREGEDTDNSKYYSEQSKMYSDAAENAIELSKPNFTVDLETGHLLYEGGRFDFEIKNGHLLWGTTL